jgi:hypothetical protein
MALESAMINLRPLEMAIAAQTLLRNGLALNPYLMIPNLMSSHILISQPSLRFHQRLNDSTAVAFPTSPTELRIDFNPLCFLTHNLSTKTLLS